MNILVFQHDAVEDPGVFCDFFREDGISWSTVETYAGQPVPDLDAFDFMVVMGGPQDVWQEDEHPWLKDEKAAIRKFVIDMKRPFLGICLGHQLLAEAIGGKVAPAKTPEIGVMDVSQSDAGRGDGVMSGVPDRFKVLQWHGAEVVRLPPGASVLATSDACPVQAYRYGEHAFGFQGHIEITKDTVPNWAAMPAYRDSDDPAMSKASLAKLARDVEASLPEITGVARSLYQNMKSIIASR